MEKKGNEVDAMAQANRMLALRLFGVSQARAQAVLKAAAVQGCPGLRLLSREEELVVCVNVRGAGSEAEADRIYRQWNEYFRQQFGPAVFGEGDTELADAALEALAKKNKLFVAADEATGHLLEGRIREKPEAAAVYDFGDHSYRHPTRANRLEPPRALLDKYPDCPVQPVAGRARQALALSGADWAVSYQPAKGVQPGFVLVCGAKTVYLHVLAPSVQPQMLAANWLLDMLRRLALGQEPAEGVQSFAYGKPAPVLPVRQTPLPAQNESAPRPAPVQPGNGAPADAWQKSPSAPVSRAANLRSAGRQLFDESVQLPEPPSRKRNPAGRILGSLVLVLFIAAVAFGVVWLVERPATQQMTGAGYGTADYDTAARDYLTKAQQGNSQVAAYLALPKLGGTLVYQPDAARPGQAIGLAVQAAQGDEMARFVSAQQPGQTRTNVIVECPTGSIQQLSELDEEELLRDNCGFTLYTDGNTYRYKVAAVYYWDPAETGETAFDLNGLQDLSDQQAFLNFVLGIKARSLYEMPVDLEDADSFATLVADAADGSGRKLAVTGRLQRQDEAAFLLGKQITQADQPLLPLAMYEQTGEEVPSVETLNQYWMNWYATGGATSSDVQEESGMPQEDQLVEGIQPLDPNATPIPTLTPPPTDTPATATPKPSATPQPGTTPKPDATQAPGATDKPQATQAPDDSGTAQPTAAPQATPAPQPTPTPTPSAGTITVTMNGVRQEMDLVECLAMIARNELGANAPIEAYKAQMVAAHSWILSQGGAPSVAGRQPSETIRQAAREVANQIVTYNGRVAFTPYFASAAFGTNPSEDVWGSSRPYLVAVESPYDQQYATNWQNTRVFTQQEVADRAMEKLGVDLYAYSEDPNEWFGDIVKNSSGYVTSLRLGTATITGQKLQENVLAGFSGRAIRSAAFDISYADGNFSITTYGYGHGGGLSQYGAWGYAANGWTYDQILAHYFPGTSLSTVG